MREMLLMHVLLDSPTLPVLAWCPVDNRHLAIFAPLSFSLSDGQLFTWGQNTNGQLGLGKGEPSKLFPHPLKSLAGIPLAQITAGGDHSFALSLSGAVFGWGKNRAGQLGLNDKQGKNQLDGKKRFKRDVDIELKVMELDSKVTSISTTRLDSNAEGAMFPLV